VASGGEAQAEQQELALAASVLHGRVEVQEAQRRRGHGRVSSGAKDTTPATTG
jgi:hypothetical protein